MSKPRSYKILDSCINCIHVFERIDYDAELDYYCREDQSERPKCDSSAMDEDCDSVEYKDWKKWAKSRAVKCNGWCKKYIKKKVIKQECHDKNERKRELKSNEELWKVHIEQNKKKIQRIKNDLY